jgi:hypothetical protein
VCHIHYYALPGRAAEPQLVEAHAPLKRARVVEFLAALGSSGLRERVARLAQPHLEALGIFGVA